MFLAKNAKIAKSSDDDSIVYNFGIPAYRSSEGEITCPAAGRCAKAAGCYAMQKTYTWDNVSAAYEMRFQLTKRDDFVDLMVRAVQFCEAKALKNGKQMYVRIHDSGDFYNLEYIAKWFQIMQACPSVKFYAYTKQVRVFRKLKNAGAWQIPLNFTLIYSFGGVFDSEINIHEDRHARVFSTREELELAGYAYTNDNDLIAIGANKKIGLVYHGDSNKEWVA